MAVKYEPLAESQDYMAKIEDKEMLIEVAKATDKRKAQFEQIAKALAAKGTR